MEALSEARGIQGIMYIESFGSCVDQFGRNTCNRADAENREAGKFMCPYNKRTGATVYRDQSQANWADSKCQNSDKFLKYMYRGIFFQDLKDWFVVNVSL